MTDETKRNLRRVALGVALCAIGICILLLSFEAAASVARGAVWATIDYWLACFAFLSFVVGLVVFVVGGIAAALATNEFC